MLLIKVLQLEWNLGPKPEAGIITSQGVIEKMFQEIILKNVPVEEAAKKAEKELNDLFAAAK